MKAMILSAGKGSRLHPISMSTPKPLVPLAGVRLLDLILSQLASQGIREVAINTSHLGDEISKIYQSGNQFGLEILYSYEGYVEDGELLPQALGSAGGLRNIQQKWKFFDDTFLVICGDAYFDINLNEAIRAHHANHALATVITVEKADDELHKYGVVSCDDDGRVVSFQEKPKAEEALSNFVNTGIYIFDRRIFEFIPAEGEYDIGSQLLPKLVRLEKPFYMFTTEGNWLDIGNIEDLHKATREVLSRNTKLEVAGKRFGQGLWISPSANVAPEMIITRGDVFIDSGATVEVNASIAGPTVIGRNCLIKEGAHLNRCIVMAEYLEFPAGIFLEDKIVTAHHVISLDGNYISLADAGILDTRRLQLNDNQKVKRLASMA